MIKFKEPTVPVRPYWQRITDIYYNDPRLADARYSGMSIWEWLAMDYGADRLSPWNDLGLLRFEKESNMTAFLLRFA